MRLEEILRETQMNENLFKYTGLLKLKISVFKKEFKKKKDEVEERAIRVPKNENYQGQLIAYEQILKLIETHLHDIDPNKII